MVLWEWALLAAVVLPQVAATGAAVMPWASTTVMTDQGLGVISDDLHALPPVVNQVTVPVPAQP